MPESNVPELERQHAGGYGRLPRGADEMMWVDAAIWADLPWDEPGDE